MPRFLIHLSLFGLLLLLICEGFFRVVVPATQTPLKRALPEYGIWTYVPNQPSRDFTAGRLSQHRVPWRINNAGWNAPKPYLKQKQKPYRIALIGDSFIEEFYNSPEHQMATYLEQFCADSVEVYSFGFSLSSLSHNLQIARYVQREFNPDAYVVLLINGDVKESVANLEPIARNMQLRFEGDSLYETPAQLTQSGTRELLKHSATLYYLISNAQWRLPSIRHPFHSEPRAFSTDNYLERAVEYLLREWQVLASGKRLLLVTDGERHSIMQGKPISPPAQLRTILRIAKQLNIETLDLNPIFMTDFQRHHTAFHFAFNPHYNPYGNALVAQAIAHTLCSYSMTSTTFFR